MKEAGICAATLWLAATFQFGLPERMALFGAKPDFLLTAAIVLAILLPRGWATAVGFLAGIWTGGLIGANMAHYALSRSVGAFGASWSQRAGLEFRTPMAGLVVFVTTIGTQLIFMFMAAPRSLGAFLLDTIGTAVVNGVLALPLFALLRLVMGRPNRRSR